MDDGSLLLGRSPNTPPYDGLEPDGVSALDGDPVPPRVSFSLGGVRVDVGGADPPLVAELARVLGGPGPAVAEPTFTFRVVPPEDGLSRIEFDGQEAAPIEDEFRLGLESPEFPFQEVASDLPGFLALAFRDHAEPLFYARGGDCRFRRVSAWRTAVALLLFHRILGLRSDAIFFHAATVGIAGRGVLLIGRKGAGKSTTALALAARGHEFLGDETAGFVPATGQVIPMRRPVGIKPGPRAHALQAGLAAAGRSPEDEGPLRLDVEELLQVGAARPLPLEAVVFLAPFELQPELIRIQPGREEISQLQPVVSSMVNAGRTRRVFELARMLSSIRTFRLAPGEPDATAAHVEEALLAAWE